MARSNDDLTLKVGFDIAKFQSELAKTNQSLSRWSSGMSSAIKGLAASFSALTIGRFVLDISRLAGEAEGVKEAFDRLPASIQLMNDLKRATGGTVSELDLMKRSVMASNFDISLKALPQLLEFATLRAKQTGQSIDYLVDSIVTGIGRKSKLILDNLGISAVQLTEALGGASTASSTIGEVADAVGKIAAKNLESMGKLSENASTKLERLAASWINLKVAMGNAANGTGLFGQGLDALTTKMELAASSNLSFFEKVAAGISPAHAAALVIKDMEENAKKLAEEQRVGKIVMRDADQAIKTFGNNLDAIKKAYAQNIHLQEILNEIAKRAIETQKKTDAAIRNEKNLTEELNTLRDESTLAVGRERYAINLKVKAIEAEIAALQKLGSQPEFDASKFQSKPLNTDHSTNKDDYFKIEPLFNGDIEIFKEELDGINAEMEESMLVSERLRGEWDKTKQSMENMGMAAASVGEEIGFAIGSAMVGTENFAQSMAQMARRIIRDLKAIAMAYMIKNSVQFGGPLGIGLAVAGMGVLEGLFSKLGAPNGGSVKSGQMAHSQTLSNGQVVQFRVQGSDLVGTLDNYNRSRARTGN